MIKKRITAFVVSVIMIFTAVTCYQTSVFAEDSKVDDLKDKISDYEKKIDEAEDKLSSLSGDINKVKEYIEELDKQIAMYQEQIDAYNDEIDAYEAKIDDLDAQNEEHQKDIDGLNEKIDEYNSQIAQMNKDIEGKYDELKELIRANYINGETSAIEVLLCSDDFSDYLTKVQLVSSLADYEQGLINTINDSIENINKVVKQIDAQKAEIVELQKKIDEKIAEAEELQNQVEANKAKVVANQNTIQEKVNQNNTYLDKLNGESDAYNDKIKEYKNEIAKFEAQIEAMIKQNASSGSGMLENSSGLICPLQYGGRYISSGFYRNSDGSYHGALDICVSGGTYGLAISAAESGTVITASYHWSYGNYIIIDHGNGLSTLYAHCSSLAVSSGQSVSKGQTIGYVGATGNVSGPHLHFEVRVNGSRVNPSNYITV